MIARWTRASATTAFCSTMRMVNPAAFTCCRIFSISRTIELETLGIPAAAAAETRRFLLAREAALRFRGRERRWPAGHSFFRPSRNAQAR
jgi:hypothetical protein